jgi:hypothetical protein
MASTASLGALATLIRDGENVISPYVRESEQDPALGALAAAGPRAEDAPDEYVLLVEAIREGYLLHYETPRLIEGADADLRLLAGDFLYALGLERLAARGDLEAVRELADLISLSAQVHEEDGAGDAMDQTVKALWLASVAAVGTGATPEHERAKDSLRRGDAEAGQNLLAAAADMARQSGLGDALARAAESIGFEGKDLPESG